LKRTGCVPSEWYLWTKGGRSIIVGVEARVSEVRLAK